MARHSGNSNEMIVISQNNKAYHDYFIDDTYEVGIVLVGSEVKSIRKHRPSLSMAYAAFAADELFVYNLHIDEYTEANRFNHYPKRLKKLLLHRRELRKLYGLIKKRGVTLVPLKFYFNQKNRAKILLGVARGKKNVDKRIAIKEKEWKREKARVMKRGVEVD